MKWLSLLGLLAGIATVAAFFWTSDSAAVGTAVMAGLPGLAAICAFRLVSLAADTAGWSVLVPEPLRPGFAALFGFRWVSKSINVLLPAMQVGGDLVRLGMLRRAGVAADAAGASVLVDVTLGFAAQAVFTFLGIAALLWVGTHTGVTIPLAVGVVLGGGVGVAFYLAQRLGVLRMLGHGARRFAAHSRHATTLNRLADGLAAVDHATMTLYRSGAAVVSATLWHLAGWLLRTADTIIALFFMSIAIGLREALIIESLALAARSAAFLIPAGLGAQEGALVLLGTAFGLTPEVALALAMIKRLQEIIVFGPGLAAWWLFERRAGPAATADRTDLRAQPPAPR